MQDSKTTKSLSLRGKKQAHIQRLKSWRTLHKIEWNKKKNPKNTQTLWTTSSRLVGIHKSLKTEKRESSISTRNSRNQSKDDREKPQGSERAEQPPSHPASDKSNVLLSHTVFPPPPAPLALITQQYLVFNPNVKPDLIRVRGAGGSKKRIQRTEWGSFYPAGGYPILLLYLLLLLYRPPTDRPTVRWSNPFYPAVT
jgi:hypothetical protein